MRILVINYEYPPIGGGGGFVTKNILEEMVVQGHSVVVITTYFKGLKKTEIVNGVNVIRVPVLFRKKLEVANMTSMITYPPSSILKVLSKFRSNQFDVINTHFAIPSGPSGYFLSKVLRLPNVLSIHGGDIFDPSKFLSPHKTPILSNTVKFMLKTADRVVAQSSDTKMNACKHYDSDRPIDIIPLGIKKPIFKKANRSDFDLGKNEIVFCTIGRLVKRKNIEDTINILYQMKDLYAFKFLIIGDGPEKEHLQKFAARIGLDGRIQFLGNISNEVKFQILDLSDIYLSTALHEGFGLVFLEAMECGLPVICYNRGGQNDFLESGKTGFLIELGNKDNFRDKIIDLLNDPKLSENVSQYNRELVKNFYIKTCSEKYISLFRELISA